MGLSIVKSFAILVVSGNGQKCNALKATLRSNLMGTDEKTGMSKVFLHKNCRKDPMYKDDAFRVAKEAGKIVQEALSDVHPYFYVHDKKINLSEQN
jgi:hypothetical protein